jgi:hypothetical protein
MDKQLPKLICVKTIGGVEALRVFTTVAGQQGAIIKQIVPLGTPYWIFSSIPAGTVVAADFTDAPLCSSDVSENNANAAPLLAVPPSVDPATVLTYS